MPTLSEQELKQVAEMVLQAKPHLKVLEDLVKEVQYGELNLSLTVRAGNIEKIVSVSEKNVWMRQKQNIDSITDK